MMPECNAASIQIKLYYIILVYFMEASGDTFLSLNRRKRCINETAVYSCLIRLNVAAVRNKQRK